jgi:hypothetical protein
MSKRQRRGPQALHPVQAKPLAGKIERVELSSFEQTKLDEETQLYLRDGWRILATAHAANGRHSVTLVRGREGED